jgi:FkbM family methyltransferase
MFNIGDKIRRNILVSSDPGIMIVNRFDYNQNNVGQGQSILDHGNICTVEANTCINAIANKKNPVIFDIGANIGAFTIWLAKYFNEGKIYSFEPQRLVFQMLCGNIAINNIFNVYAYNLAFSKDNCRIEIQEPNYNIPNDFGTFSLVNNTINDKSEKIILDLYTIDNFVIGQQIENIDLIKIDAEGMDLQILHGAIETIKKYKPVIFVEFFDNNKSIQNELETFLKDLNYSKEILGNNILGIPNGK